ncbi:hypothetical protein [Arenibacter sp. S6351L]|uniref:hypothetical protein n=1 Tax=Arenibacter sp. S6351L TaxID=2926407 RepID=UPI001FF3C371|nr:hypothetical protein [Arenibacter sp. S6351L]MCK0135022.1 hypothetical protein [Arenibacter sp. S6351L]
MAANAQSAINLPEPDFVGVENIQLGVPTNYELDLWDRIRSSVQVEKFRSEASLYDYRTATIIQNQSPKNNVPVDK